MLLEAGAGRAARRAFLPGVVGSVSVSGLAGRRSLANAPAPPLRSLRWLCVLSLAGAHAHAPPAFSLFIYILLKQIL